MKLKDMISGNFAKAVLAALGISVLSCSAASASIKVDEAFPDAVLRKEVGDIDHDLDRDGYLTDEELSTIHYLKLGSGVHSLEGLEYLSSLTSLILEDTSVTQKNLDLRGLSSLRSLALRNNGFTRIDLSQNTVLASFELENEKIQTVDVSGKKHLWDVIIKDCPIREINAKNASKLENLEIRNSESASMDKLDVSGCSSLESLFISRADFKALDFGILEKLSSLTLEDFPALTKINLAGLKNLTYLDLTRCGKLAGVDVSGNKKLERLSVYDCRNLSGLDLSKNKALHLYLFRTRPLKEMIKSGKKNIVTMSVEDLAVDKSLSMKSFSGLKFLNIGYCKGLSAVDVSGNKLEVLSIRSDSVKELTVKGSSSMNQEDGLTLICPNLKTLNLENVKNIAEWNGSSGSSDEDERVDGTLDNCEKLKKLVFKGNAPKFDPNAFLYLEGVSVYYPYGYASWKASVRKNYTGKDITWIAYDQTTGRTVKNPNKDNVLKAGDTYKDPAGGGVYKVNKDKKSFTLTGVVNKSADTLVIPKTITVGSEKYKVTAIAAGACKGNKKLKSVDIGSGIKKIGKNAFYGCRALKNITIRAKKLSSGTVGSKAFKGTSSKAVVKVPKSKLSAYKKLLKKKGISSKAKFKGM